LNDHYFDLNAGALFTTSTTDDNDFYAGLSVYHINRPEQSFAYSGNKALYLLYPRATLHAGGYFPVGDITTLNLSGLFSTQAGATETVIGGALEFNLEDKDGPNESDFYIGSWLRFGDAIIPYVGIEYENMRFGLTYDVNTSSLKTASDSQGGVEISLIYIAKKAQNKGIPCPKF
jgi:type IX secretion system PorP/SprF family membrane protein